MFADLKSGLGSRFRRAKLGKSASKKTNNGSNDVSTPEQPEQTGLLSPISTSSNPAAQSPVTSPVASPSSSSSARRSNDRSQPPSRPPRPPIEQTLYPLYFNGTSSSMAEEVIPEEDGEQSRTDHSGDAHLSNRARRGLSLPVSDREYESISEPRLTMSTTPRVRPPQRSSSARPSHHTRSLSQGSAPSPNSALLASVPEGKELSVTPSRQEEVRQKIEREKQAWREMREQAINGQWNPPSPPPPQRNKLRKKDWKKKKELKPYRDASVPQPEAEHMLSPYLGTSGTMSGYESDWQHALDGRAYHERPEPAAHAINPQEDPGLITFEDTQAISERIEREERGSRGRPRRSSLRRIFERYRSKVRGKND
ncbi:hypothetical protein KEM55_007985 [Ascosphaera atra]|nr:hypothetical protein KEM55_007985 [Ascosphaera atra]